MFPVSEQPDAEILREVSTDQYATQMKLRRDRKCPGTGSLFQRLVGDDVSKTYKEVHKAKPKNG